MFQHYLLLIPQIKFTAWKIVGYLGAFIFASRWLIQMYASKQARRPVMTRLFWFLSLAGSILLLLYFIFGKNDSVGIITNLFPLFIAGYNIYLDTLYSKTNKTHNTAEYKVAHSQD